MVTFNILVSECQDSWGKRSWLSYSVVDSKERWDLWTTGVHHYNSFICFDLTVKKENYEVVKKKMNILKDRLNGDNPPTKEEIKDFYRKLDKIYG